MTILVIVGTVVTVTLIYLVKDRIEYGDWFWQMWRRTGRDL